MMQNQDDADIKRKRNLFVLCASITIAAFLILTIINFFERNTPEVLLNLVVIAFMLAGLIAIKLVHRDLLVYRIVHFLTTMLFFYGVALGTGKETVLYWVLIMPLLFFYFFGKREGSIWTAIFSVWIFFIILVTSLSGTHIYSAVMIPRFAIILFVVIVIGYGQEASRDTYSRLLQERNEDLRREKERLERALSEIKTLSGLIPICCNCKKIRNDEGYWQQVEIYVRDRTQADFSHGICPECFEKLYPEYRLPPELRKPAPVQNPSAAPTDDPQL